MPSIPPISHFVNRNRRVSPSFPSLLACFKTHSSGGGPSNARLRALPLSWVYPVAFGQKALRDSRRVRLRRLSKTLEYKKDATMASGIICMQWSNSPRGSLKGAAAPFMAIRSGDMRGARDRSRARPVGDEARRSVGNRKECRLRHDYASFPEGRSLLPLSLEVCPKGARRRPHALLSEKALPFSTSKKQVYCKYCLYIDTNTR